MCIAFMLRFKTHKVLTVITNIQHFVPICPTFLHFSMKIHIFLKKSQLATMIIFPLILCYNLCIVQAR